MKTSLRLLIASALVAGLSACVAQEKPGTEMIDQNITSAGSGPFGACIEHAYLAGMRIDEAKFIKGKLDRSEVPADGFMYRTGEFAAKAAVEQRRIAEKECQAYMSTLYSKAPSTPPRVASTSGEGTAVYFDMGSTALSSEERNKLEEVVESYKASPATEVVLIGRTDTTGSAGFNQALSTKRAMAVYDELKKIARESNVNLPPGRIEIVGKGEVNGPQDNANRADRRVEITLTRSGRAQLGNNE